jgi:hypothetical protein
MLQIEFTPRKNTARLYYKDQTLVVVWGTILYIMWDSRATNKSALLANAEFMNVKGGGTYSYHCVLSGQEGRISEGQ